MAGRDEAQFAVLVLLLSGLARGEALVDPPVLKARNGNLQVMVVAREQRLTTLPGRPVGWVYEICPYAPADGALRRCPTPGVARAQLATCPTAEDPPVTPYGGARLQVEPGDELRIRFVNCLPPVAHDRPFPGEFRFVGAGGETLLQYNPSNLHTHGLLVEPRCATGADPTYGDWMFVLALNPAGGFPRSLAGRHACQPTSPRASEAPVDHSTHWDIAPDGVVDYRIRLPRDHPSGLYWVHSHAHGLSLNQVTAGLATLLTVGPMDYLCGAPGCSGRPGGPRIRHLVLQDSQVMPTGILKLQEDADFCGKAEASDQAPQGEGGCPGSGKGYDGGRWAFTLNGQVNPHLDLGSAGEIWRILNASGNATYLLGLQDLDSGSDLPFQVLSVDGVSLEIPPGTTTSDLQGKLGRKVQVVPCPDLQPAARSKLGREPVCAVRMLMMPSSRVEVGVVPRAGARRAVLRTYRWSTGPDGDVWPAVALASVGLPQSTKEPAYVPVRGESALLTGATGLLRRMLNKTRTGGAPPDPSRCHPLSPGRARQIVFGQPAEHLHGLGYREVPADQPLGPPAGLTIKVFDHAAGPTVCVPLAPGNRPVSEVWELVNVAGEDHNFHVHQARFELLRTETLADGSRAPERLDRGRILHDNVPLPRGGPGCNGTVEAWQRGACVPSRVVVRIPFNILGDFVYHCHILSHEDAGMMAKISVVPATH
jgi:FtsP/CotA-like multicopper oxidase with cupredoxin domain